MLSVMYVAQMIIGFCEEIRTVTVSISDGEGNRLLVILSLIARTPPPLESLSLW